MNKPDYQHFLFDLIFYLKDKSEYLKNEDALSPDFNEDVYEGMKLAYHFVMDGIKVMLESYDLPLDYYGFDDFNPNDILDFQPKNYDKLRKDDTTS
ncbi:MAG: hypothetical protein NVV59_00085 [Chitinophagaceae bacterium]|nr:hypothetical protein [Chitinophagaceae bacterium]